ncbi:MAG: CCA tRNA nucleotidyltransferase [Planctomycetota bacterium]|nr:CCA tRNA nucleotidyltransferase [Planctomycetota bacterium]
MESAEPESRMRAEALEVARTLRAAGHQALFCGGAVRDRFLQRAVSDYDIATSATPEQGLELFPEAVAVGAQFGVLVLPRPGGDIEVATFRDDGLYVDGRRPEGVQYSDPPRDAQRRDFTVNGLFEDPETGAIQDHVGGLEDLERRMLRAIGDPAARFREDHLRILRAVRFAVQLDFAIEPATWRAVRELAPLVADVSAERIRQELIKIVRHGRGAGLRLLRDAGLLPHVLPELEVMRGVTQPAIYHPEGDVFVHTCLVVDHVQFPEGVDPAGEDARDLLFAAVLHDIAKPPTRTVDPDGRIRFNGHDVLGVDMAAAVLERLRFPRKSIDRIGALIRAHIMIASTPKMRTSKLRRFLAQDDIELHLALHAADCAASHGFEDILLFLRERLAAYANEPVLPPPLLKGKDLIDLGYPAGPAMGTILRWVQDEQLEGRLADRDAAVRRVRVEFPNPDGEQPGDGST